MAAGKNGSFVITNTGQSGLSMGATRITWAEEYDVASNTSTVKITKLELLAGGDGYGNRNYGLGNLWFNGSVSINGTVVANVTRGSHFLCVPEYNAYKELSISSPALPWSASVAHDSDGSKSVSISVSLHALSSGNDARTNTSINGSSTVQLTTIPRASTLTVSDGTIGSPMTITINRASTAFTHKLTYYFGVAIGTISSNASTSVSWTPPMSLCAEIPNAVSGIGNITCETWSGSTKIGSTTKTITLTCPSSVKPSVSSGWAAVGYLNTGTAAANMACFVQGYSRAKVTLDSTKVTHSYGATTASTKITFGGEDYTDTTPVLTVSGEQSIVVTLTDSRGRTATQTVTFTVLPYSKPVLSGVEVFRCLSDGTADDAGTSFSAKASVSFSDLGGENSATLTVKYKAAGGSFGGSTAIQPDTPSRFDGILTTATYVVRITAADELGQSSYNEISIPTASVGMHIRPGHDGAAFGKYCERANALELPDGWSIFSGDRSVTFGNPRNLLDNSDFRNPVNQRGLQEYTSNGYSIDRWIFEKSGNVNARLVVQRVEAGFPEDRISLQVGSGFADFYQKLENYDKMAGKRYTIAVNINGVVYAQVFTMGNFAGGISLGNDGAVFYSTPNQHVLIRSTTAPGFNMLWMALYEGEYTAETLPEYRCKGYGAELAECQRYYYRNWDGDMLPQKLAGLYAPKAGRTTSVVFPVTMRETPSITLYNPISGNKNCVGDWTTDEDVSTSALYVTKHHFMISGNVEASKMYSYLYEATADL